MADLGYNVGLRRTLAVLAIACASFAFAASASAASGDLRIGSNQPFDSPNPFQAVLAVAVDSYALAYYDQLHRAQGLESGPRLQQGARVERRRVEGRQDDHVPPALGDHLVGRRPLHERRRALDVQRDVAQQDQPAAHDDLGREVRLRARCQGPSCCISRRATPSSSRSSRCRCCPKHIWSKIPLAKLDKVSGPIPTVTTAPYMLTQWHKNGTTILERNPKYDLARNGGKEPAVKRILVTTYQNTDAVYRDVAQGNLDVAFNGPVDWVPRARKNSKLTLISAPRGGYWEIAFNSCPPTGSPVCSGPAKGVKVKVVQDPAIRKALAYGIDREKFIPLIYQGQGSTAYGLISPRFKLYFEDLSKDPKYAYAYDPAKAKQILKDGGWNCSTTPCTKNGVKAQFELATLADSEPDQQMAQRAAADARKLGIVIDTTFLSEDALNNRIYASGKTKDKYGPNYDAFIWDWDVGGVTPTPILEVLRSFDASSDSFYASKAYDAALLRAKEATSFEGTVDGVQTAAKIELDDLPYLPLVHLNAIDVIRKDTWHGWVRSPAPDGEPLFQTSSQFLALQPGPAPVASTGGGTPAAAVTTDSGWLTTPRSVLIGFGLLSLAIIASTFIASGRRRTEPPEWTEE